MRFERLAKHTNFVVHTIKWVESRGVLQYDRKSFRCLRSLGGFGPAAYPNRLDARWRNAVGTSEAHTSEK